MDAEFGSGRRVVAIVQARLGSVRLPAKVLSPALGRPMLAHLLERLSRSETVDQIVVAIPTTAANDGLANLATELQVACFRGEEHDVLDRYFRAGDSAGASIVVRITGFCAVGGSDPTSVRTADRISCVISGSSAR